MNAKIAKAIAAVWAVMKQEHSDHSTEWLLEATSDIVRRRRLLNICDAADVAEALIITGEFVPAPGPTK